MNLKETGVFIAECRKEKGLTQEKLAGKLFISEKTVSKWECGKGFPDSSLILPLCDELGITANELLSGKHLSNENYKEIAEHNLIALKRESEKYAKHLLIVENVVGFTSSVFFMLAIFSASFFIENLAWRIVLISLGFVNFFTALGACLYIEKSVGFYECGCCHHKYVPSYRSVFFSLHIGRTRFLKCPKCHKRSWSKKVTNAD